MSILELALAIALAEVILVVGIGGLVLSLWAVIAIPCSIVEYYQDKKKEKELMFKGAKNIKVKNGIIYQVDENEKG